MLSVFIQLRLCLVARDFNAILGVDDVGGKLAAWLECAVLIVIVVKLELVLATMKLKQD